MTSYLVETRDIRNGDRLPDNGNAIVLGKGGFSRQMTTVRVRYPNGDVGTIEFLDGMPVKVER